MLHLKVPGGNELLNPQHLLADELQINYGSKVADLGCGGVGFFSFQAAKLVGDGGLVYAVDIIKDNLKSVASKARQDGYYNIRTLWSNLEIYSATKINDQSLDFCLLINVLFQNKYPEKIIKEATRLLKPRGKLLIIDWREGRFPIGPEPQQRVSLKRTKETAEALGLKLTKEFNAGQYHFGLIFEKVILRNVY